MEENSYKKRILFFVAIIVIFFSIITFNFLKGLPTFKKVNDNNLKNTALVIYDKKHPLEKKINKQLKTLSNQYKVDMYKIDYKNFESYCNNKGKEFITLNNQIQKIEQKIFKNVSNKKKLNKVNTIYIQAINKKLIKKDINNEVKQLCSLTKLSNKEIEQLIELKCKYNRIMLNGSIKPEILPCIILFKNNEITRISALPSDKNRLEEKLLNNHFELLSHSNHLNKITNNIKKKKTFLVMFGNSYQTQLKDINEYFKRYSKKQDFNYLYADLSNLENSKKYREFLSSNKNNLKKELQTTPTFIIFKEGKEFFRFNGPININQANDLINLLIKK